MALRVHLGLELIHLLVLDHALKVLDDLFVDRLFFRLLGARGMLHLGRTHKLKHLLLFFELAMLNSCRLLLSLIFLLHIAILLLLELLQSPLCRLLEVC